LVADDTSPGPAELFIASEHKNSASLPAMLKPSSPLSFAVLSHTCTWVNEVDKILMPTWKFWLAFTARNA
jgi:hypothetical protein